MLRDSRSWQRVESHREALRNLGTQGYVRRLLARRNNRGFLTSKHLNYPVYFRPGTSDLRVFEQIFTQREYQSMDVLENVGLIIDCGANVGYSSAYFLSRFPKAHVVAVEPDRNNFAQLEKNLQPYAGRFRAHQTGVWSRSTKLSIEPALPGDEWGIRVVEDPAGHLEAVDIGTLLQDSGYDRISLLKMDIEGSEFEIFSKNPDWLDVVDAIAIELHGKRCQDVFLGAIKNRGFRVHEWGELTIAMRG